MAIDRKGDELMAVDRNSSLKERVEQTVINLLCENETLALLVPTKQNEDAKNKRPKLVVVATPGKEVAFGLGVHRVAVEITLEFNAKAQTPEDLDVAVQLVRDRLKVAQSDRSFGLLIDGEATAFEDETVRKRTINVTILAA